MPDETELQSGNTVLNPPDLPEWQKTPQFKALSDADKQMFRSYVATGQPAMAQSVRESCVVTILSSAQFIDANIQPTFLEVIRKSPNAIIGPLSNFIATPGFTAPNLSKLKDQDVGNAQRRGLRLIGAIGKTLAQVSIDPGKTILGNTIDAFGIGDKVKPVFVDDTDPIVQANPNVGDLVYGGGSVGFNVIGFGIKPDGIDKELDLACTAAHALAHCLREAWHAANPTPNGSHNHFLDEIYAYSTEFAVRWLNNSGHPTTDDMEKACDALMKPPYKYGSATGDEAEKIKATVALVKKGGGESQRPPPPDGASWNTTNDP